MREKTQSKPCYYIENQSEPPGATWKQANKQQKKKHQDVCQNTEPVKPQFVNQMEVA
jgi:hypothetical protein